jgi:hypothetical protein
MPADTKNQLSVVKKLLSPSVLCCARATPPPPLLYRSQAVAPLPGPPPPLLSTVGCVASTPSTARDRRPSKETEQEREREREWEIREQMNDSRSVDV